MPEPTPSRPADRNLLFGILALQMDFIGRDALIAAMHAWVLDKAKPLEQILVEQRSMQPSKRDLLEPLARAHPRRTPPTAMDLIAGAPSTKRWSNCPLRNAK